MSYKFGMGPAILSGSLVQKGAAEVDALVADSLNLQSGDITGAGAIATNSLSLDGVDLDSTLTALQADVDQNESDADAAMVSEAASRVSGDASVSAAFAAADTAAAAAI